MSGKVQKSLAQLAAAQALERRALSNLVSAKAIQEFSKDSMEGGKKRRKSTAKKTKKSSKSKKKK
jgi:hypothetical protein